MEEYYLLTFESTHAAIATEKLLKPVDIIVMPVPRFVSSSCGISIRINPEKRDDAEKIIKEKSQLKIYSGDEQEFDYNYYHVINNEGKITCERVTL